MRRTIASFGVVCGLVLGLAGPVAAAGTIDGTVTEAGSPSQSATVTLYRQVGGAWEPAADAQTTAGGAFSFDVANDTPGESFRIGFSKPGWRSEFYDDKATVDEATDVPIDSTLAADLQAVPQVSGTVTDQDSGLPLENAVVLLFGEISDVWAPIDLAFTDAAGKYSVDILEEVAGPYRVGFGLDGYVTEYFDDSPFVDVADDVDGGDVADAALRPVAYIEGTVTAGGDPVGGVEVVGFDQGDDDGVAEVARTTTEADGSYRLPTDLGEFVVRFTKNGLRTEFYDDSPDFAGSRLVPVYGSNVPPGADPEAQLNVDADLAPGTEIEDLETKVKPRDLAKALVGDGVSVEEVEFTGDDRQAGLFRQFDPLGFEEGIALSTGAVVDSVGPNDRTDTSGSFEGPGDPDLDDLSQGGTYDATVLTMTVIPSSDRIRFAYIFGSEEYNEYLEVNPYPDKYHDVFGFYINGKNCALVEEEPVSVGTVNSQTNSGSFRNNDFGARSPVDIELDGLTTELTCSARVKKGARTNIKLAIADVADWGIDSTVFLDQGSLTANQPPTAQSQELTTQRNTPVDVTLAGEDPDGDTVTFQVIDQPADGTLSGTGDKRTYTPKPGFVGSDSFTYVALDVDGRASLLATVTIDVVGSGPPTQGPPVQTPPTQGPPVQTPAQPKIKVRKKVKRYSSFPTRRAWLRAASVRLPDETSLGQPVEYVSRTKNVCTVTTVKGIWRVKGEKLGVCRLSVRASATDSAAALSRRVKVRITR